MQSSYVKKGFGGGLGELIGAMATGDHAYDAGVTKGRKTGATDLYNHARAMNENNEFQARQSITPDMLSGIADSLPAGMGGDLASLLLKGGGFDVSNWSKGLGNLQENSARTTATNSINDAGLDPTSLGAMMNAIASGNQMPDIYSHSKAGTVNKFTGDVTNVPPGVGKGGSAPSAALLKLLSTVKGEGTDLDGNPVTYADPAMLQELAKHYGLPTQGQFQDQPADLGQIFANAITQPQYNGPYRPDAISPQMPQVSMPPNDFVSQIPEPSYQQPPMTATGPNGQKIQLINGQWVPVAS